MKAVILCAGLGKRMGSYTKDCPKPLLKIKNLTIIEWQIIALKKVGVTKIFINLHYLSKMIVDHLKDGKYLGVKIEYIYQRKLNGTGGGLKLFENFLKNENFFFVIYGDIITNESLDELIKFHIFNKAECSVYFHERKNSNSLLYINEKNGLVIDFIERPNLEERKNFIKKHKIRNHYVNSGIYLMNPSIFSYIINKSFIDIPKDIFQKIILKDKLFALKIKKNRFAIDTVEKLNQARKFFAE